MCEDIDTDMIDHAQDHRDNAPQVIMKVITTIITVVIEKSDIIVVTEDLIEINTTVIVVVTTHEVTEDIENEFDIVASLIINY